MAVKDKIKEGSISIGKTGLYLKATTCLGYHINFNFVQLPELKTIGVSNITQDQRFIFFADYDKISMEQLHGQIQFLFKQYGLTHVLVITTGADRYHVINFEKFMASEIQEIINNTVCDYSFKTVALKSDKGWILRLYPKLDVDGNVVKSKPDFLDFIVNENAKEDIRNGRKWKPIPRYGYFPSYGAASQQNLFGQGIYSRGIPVSVPQSISVSGHPEKKAERELSRAHLELFAKIYPEFVPFFNNDAVLGEELQDNLTNVHVVKYGTSARNLLLDFDLDDLVNSKKITINWEEEMEDGSFVKSEI